MSEAPFNINLIKEKFSIGGDLTEYERIHNGHINSTFVLTFDENGKEVKYILQMINTGIFKDPEKLMSNIVGVTQHIGEKGWRGRRKARARNAQLHSLYRRQVLFP